MPNRKYQSSSPYRYGFNGKENDIEAVTTGEGTQDYGMRIYNPSLGKFLSVDPLAKGYPWYTPYQFAGNKPIVAVDLDGAEELEVQIRPIPTNPKLSQVFVSKVMEQKRLEDPNFGKCGVQYTTYDENNNIVTSVRQAELNINSSEVNYMSSSIKYYETSRNTDEAKTSSPWHVMRESGYDLEGKPTDNSNGLFTGVGRVLTGHLSFRYQTDVLFNPDKSTLTEATLQSGTFVDAMNSLSSLAAILKRGSISGTKTKKGAEWPVPIEIKGWKLQVNGITDASPSNYKGCGNSCLGDDRATNVLYILRYDGVTNPATISHQETYGPVNSEDRKATIDISPPQ